MFRIERVGFAHAVASKREMTSFGYGGAPTWFLFGFGIIVVAYLGIRVALDVRRRNRENRDPPST
jgi:hypothetical protein